jgi:hypothetical protein
MPGELLPTMAAPSVSKSKLLRAKADLYLIVSKQGQANVVEANKLLVRRRYNLRAGYSTRSRDYEAVAGLHRVQVPTWYSSRAGICP